MDPPGAPSPVGRRQLRPVALLLGGGLALLGLAWVAGALLTGGEVPRGTTVAGVPVGGLDEDEARARLQEELGARTDRGLAVTVDGQERAVAADEAGLEVDYAATVAAAGAS